MLERFQKVYEEEDYSCVFIPQHEENPLDLLLVFIGSDYKQREQHLQITSQEQELAQSIAKNPVQGHYFRVQFSFSFPFKVETAALLQISSLLF